MIEDARNKPISQLFDVDSNVVYLVPKYQREFTWVKSQWEALFDDIIDNNPGYFLGSFICIKLPGDTLTPQLEVVDGQQRLLTLSILFAAIYQLLKFNEHDLNDDQRIDLANLRRKLVLKRDNRQIRVIPQIQNNNQNDYRAALGKAGVIEPFDAPAYAGNRKIFRAYRFFQDRLANIMSGNNDVDEIMAILEKVNQACLVKIEVATYANAYILFESLNNRGVPLTAIDLIKNKLLARLESNEPGGIDYYFEDWNRLLSYLGDDYSAQERFFRQYYNAFREDLKHVFQVPVATRSNLIQIYDKLIDQDAKDCLTKLITAGKTYSLFISWNHEERLEEYHKPLKDLDRIQGAPSYLLLLFLFNYQHNLDLGKKHLVEIITFLALFFVRRNLTDTPPTRDLTRLFMEIVRKTSGLRGEKIVREIKEHLISVSASDDVFRSKLEGPIYEENSWVTRFILCSIAEHSMTKESWVDLWRLDKKHYVWTIEHIFPQGQNIPQSWIDSIAQGDVQKAKEYQQTHVHKLGNLTISAYNPTLGNKSFIEKRDRKDKQGRPLGYNNGLKLNEDLATKDTWSIQMIDSRTTKLVERAISLFQLKED